MPADILLYVLIAAGLVFWLKNILGTRDEDDENDRPRIFPDSEKEESLMRQLKEVTDKAENNVVSLGALTGGSKFHLPRNVRIDNKTAENVLLDIAEKHENFDLPRFAEGAPQAFTMVVEAFADGDRETLENLLVPSVYKAFDSALKERKKRKESVETEIKEVRKADIIEAAIKDKKIFITVRFTAQEICVIRNSKEEIISGDPEKVTEMVDVWVFTQDVDSSDPAWLVSETRDEEVEEHKTPLPESNPANEKDKK